MQPCYYIIESQTSTKLPATVREATAADFERTAQEHWQTDWCTDFIQDTALDKYALELDNNQRTGWTCCLSGYAGGRAGLCGVYGECAQRKSDTVQT